MTALEKLEKEHPERICSELDGEKWAADCPWHYNYLPPTEECDKGERNCRECWDREIPETVTNATDGVQLMSCAFCTNVLLKRPSNPLPDGWTWDGENYVCPECNEKEKKDMSTAENVKITPDYEAQCKALTDRCCQLERTVKALEIENKGLETYIEVLEARLSRYEIVVKCLEALTGQSLGIE